MGRWVVTWEDKEKRLERCASKHCWRFTLGGKEERSWGVAKQVLFDFFPKKNVIYCYQTSPKRMS